MSTTPNVPLDQFQHWMQQLLLNPYAENARKYVDQIVNPSEKLAAAEHLAIYQRSYIARLRDCMSQQFSALEYALGKDLFQAFADEYLRLYPSSSYSLNGLGAQFPHYLSETRPDKDEAVKEDWPDFMIELSQFEYDLNLIFHEEANEEYIVATTNTAEDNLTLLPVFRLFEFQFPIRWYYSEFSAGNEPELPYPKTSHCLILRHNYRLSLFDLRVEHYHFLRLFQSGHSFTETKEILVKEYGADRTSLEQLWPTWKSSWIKAGFFCQK